MRQRDERFDQVADAVRRSGGLLETDVGELRDEYGAGRVGRVVRKEISQALATRGIRHWPPELPDHQGHEVLLYCESMLAGQAMAAALQLAEYERQAPKEVKV